MFIETSALDASNVELAFQKILTGLTPFPLVPVPPFFLSLFVPLFFSLSLQEIYRFVSNKDLENKTDATSSSAPPAGGDTIAISAPPEAKKEGAGPKCC